MERKDISLSQAQYARLERARQLHQLLKPFEQRVVEMAIQGYTTRDIANRLGRGSKTIDKHIENITGKGRKVYGKAICFRSHIVPEMCCYYFFYSSNNQAHVA